eukprot:gene10965-17076_t
MGAAFPLLAMALLCCVPAGFSTEVKKPLRVNRISPSSAGTADEKLVKIYGQGFSPNPYMGSNVVYIGPYLCKVVTRLSTDSMISCTTSPDAVAGRYEVKVLVNNGDFVEASNSVRFDFYYRAAPELAFVHPNAGPPGMDVSLYGYDDDYRIRWQCGETDENCISSINMGDSKCKVLPSNEDFFKFQPAFARLQYSYSWNSFQINCTVLDSSDLGNMPGQVAGSSNVSVKFRGDYEGATSTRAFYEYSTDAKGIPYMFQLYPIIHSVMPSGGSVAGGTSVTIQGRGFPTIAGLIGDSLSITLAGGSTCEVMSTNYSTIICKTSPQPDKYTVPAAIKGVYPGARGIEFELYRNTNLTNDLHTLNDTVTVENSDGFRSILTGRWEEPDDIHYEHSARTKAFYTAPLTGDYSFYITGRDAATLNGTYMDDGKEVTTAIMSSNGSYSSSGSLPYYLTAAMPVSLTSGQAILLEVATNMQSSSAFQVGVRVPRVGLEPAYPSIRESAQIRVNIDGYYSSSGGVSFMYMWPRGDTIMNITVVPASSGESHLFMDPRIAVNISLANSADDASNQLYYLLGYWPSVFKELAPDNSYVTFQVSFRAGGPNLTSVGATATLVRLPSATSYYQGSVCNFTQPKLPSDLSNLLSISMTVTSPEAVTPTGTWRMRTVALDSVPAGGVVSIRVAKTTSYGTLMLGIGGDCSTISIDLDLDTSDSISKKLSTLPALKGIPPSNVINQGSYIDITFSSLHGDLPDLYVAEIDLTRLQSAVVTTSMNGSSDFFYSPIPTEFTKLAAASPDTILLSVNSIPAGCIHHSACTFTYSKVATPSVTSASPTSLSFTSDATLQLDIIAANKSVVVCRRSALNGQCCRPMTIRGPPLSWPPHSYTGQARAPSQRDQKVEERGEQKSPPPGRGPRNALPESPD